MGECFSFSVYFPSAGPPAHRKETRLAEDRERKRARARASERASGGKKRGGGAEREMQMGEGMICKWWLKALYDLGKKKISSRTAGGKEKKNTKQN